MYREEERTFLSRGSSRCKGPEARKAVVLKYLNAVQWN